MNNAFSFAGFAFDPQTFSAQFEYRGNDQTTYIEKIQFKSPSNPSAINYDLLHRALFLAFVLIGTSYYKISPTRQVVLDFPIDDFQADFFTKVYQEGLSQFAFENHLGRNDLAEFKADSGNQPEPIAYDGTGLLVLQSGGKDSLLTAELLRKSNHVFTPLFISPNHEIYPKIIDTVSSQAPQIIVRKLDLKNIRQSHGLNGHVPITYIVLSLALIQAIINHQNSVVASIAWEGNEPHAKIDNLEVNHQWSKSWLAEQLFAEYVHRYLSPNLHVGSPLRKFSELRVAELFVEHCWQKYGHSFSSCNLANYGQDTGKSQLSWCGKCAKCANSYLLFCPFLSATSLQTIFNDKDLFQDPELINTFKGLLGVDNIMKPFECIGTIAELRQAYWMRKTGYGALPFLVPKSDFDYQKEYPHQPYFGDLIS